MIVCPVKVVKVAVLSLFIIALVGCGGGSGSISGAGTDANTNSENANANTNSENANTSNNNDVVLEPSYFSGTGTVSLSWTAPTTYTDGSSLANLAGHNIYINAGSGYELIAKLNNPSVSSYLVENLSKGTYTFAVAAFNSSGNSSSYSNIISVTINS